MIQTLPQHIARSDAREESSDLPWLLSGITLATKIVESRIRRVALLDLHGSANAVNDQGEVKEKLEIISNEALLHCLGVRNNVFALVSQENEKPITFDRVAGAARYVLVFDPLDGSSNIEVNINVGTSFSIYRRIGYRSMA